MSLVDKSAWAVLVVGAVGCAHTPDVTMKYYLSASKVTFKVTRTLACDAVNGKIVSTADAVPTIQAYADRSKPAAEVRIAPLQGWFANSDIKFEFYDDGRLKGINATSTGQGETILKTAIAIATMPRILGSSPKANECAEVLRVGKQSPISLVYVGDVDVESAAVQSIQPDTLSRAYLQLLPPNIVAPICAVVKEVDPAAIPASYTAREGDVLVPMRQPGLVRIRVAASFDPACDGGDPIWDGKVLAGQRGTPYSLPIPRAAMFGKQTFVLAVDPSGAATQIQYATETGVGQALNVLSTGLTELQNEDSKRAAAARAEADLIAAQQRLVRCRADPKSCS